MLCMYTYTYVRTIYIYTYICKTLFPSSSCFIQTRTYVFIFSCILFSLLFPFFLSFFFSFFLSSSYCQIGWILRTLNLPFYLNKTPAKVSSFEAYLPFRYYTCVAFLKLSFLFLSVDCRVPRARQTRHERVFSHFHPFDRCDYRTRRNHASITIVAKTDKQPVAWATGSISFLHSFFTFATILYTYPLTDPLVPSLCCSSRR